MSIALMTEAWKAELPSGRKFVLLSLCDNANDQGECYPSIAMIAKRCSMSVRAVQGHILALESDGVVVRVERVGRSTLYRINPRRICTPAESAPPQNLRPSPAESAPPPAESAPPTPAESAPITIIEPSLNPKGTVKAAQKRSEMVGQIFKIDDVDPLVLQDFVALRKAHKAPLTATAVSDLRTQAAKAGLTLQQVMQECCARGWRGFKAEWLQGRQSSAQRVQVGQPQSFAQQDREAGWARWEEMTGRVHPDRAAAQQIRPVQDFVIDASAGLVAGGAVFPALEG